MTDEIFEEINKVEDFGTLAFSIRFGQFSVEQLDKLSDLCVTMASFKVGDMAVKTLDEVYMKTII